jgi:hypothetical protein
LPQISCVQPSKAPFGPTRRQQVAADVARGACRSFELAAGKFACDTHFLASKRGVEHSARCILRAVCLRPFSAGHQLRRRPTRAKNATCGHTRCFVGLRSTPLRSWAMAPPYPPRTPRLSSCLRADKLRVSRRSCDCGLRQYAGVSRVHTTAASLVPLRAPEADPSTPGAFGTAVTVPTCRALQDEASASPSGRQLAALLVVA